MWFDQKLISIFKIKEGRVQYLFGLYILYDVKFKN